MNELEPVTRIGPVEIDVAQAQDAAGGGDGCTLNDIVPITQSLIQAYDNLVDFTSHVIERVANS
jgi:hypothetical protein